jgi:hypothetical protein
VQHCSIRKIVAALALGPVLLLAQETPPAATVAESSAMPATPPANPNWSADMLTNLLKEPARPQTPVALDEGIILRSYQLRHLHVGETRVQNLIGVLQKLLPPGSSVRPDNRDNANMLHVLTTPVAHAAAADYISAVDAEEPAVAPAKSALSEEMRQALAKLEKLGDTTKVVAAVNNAQSSFDRRFTDLAATQKRLINFVLLGLVGAVVVVGLGLILYLRRRAEAAPLAPATALVTLQPEQVSTALAPLREEMQTRMLETLNQAAVGLEAWANKRKEEQEALIAIVQRQSNSLDAAQLALQKTRTQYMEESNRLLVEQRQITGNLAESNSRIEGTMREMQVQTNRTEAIAEELKRAVSDLDRARDEQAQTLAEIAALHERLQAEKTGTEQLRADLLLKEKELMRQQATLVSLQILLEEDRPLPPGAFDGNFGLPARPPAPPPDAGPRPPPIASAAVTLPAVTPIAQPPCHFQFLPPDHPETPSPS